MAMLNQIHLTPQFIKKLQALISVAGVGISQCEREMKEKPELKQDFLLNILEDQRQAKAAVEDFCWRATHDDYGDEIK
jgi:hypothetical protein